jgi:FkbM family methyltransferase
MLIDFRQLFPKYGIKPKGVLHVGANVGEEASVYLDLGVHRQIWIEANPEIFSILTQKVLSLPGQFDNNQLFFCNFCIGDIDGEDVTFNISNNGSQSSSIFEFGTHSIAHPEVKYVSHIKMKTSRIDTVFNNLNQSKNLRGYNSFDSSVFDFLNIDLQGAELKALRGMGDLLHQFKWAYLEVNKEELYKGCPMVEDLDLYLLGFGFRRSETRWCGNTGWGDALYIKGL